jgi:hypothetical protein
MTDTVRCLRKYLIDGHVRARYLAVWERRSRKELRWQHRSSGGEELVDGVIAEKDGGCATEEHK